MRSKMVCITCPIGCELEVEVEDGEISVSGNNCKRGEVYAKAEVTSPKRMITSVVNIDGGKYHCASVKTTKPIDKDKIFDVLNIIRGLKIKAPLRIGDVVVKNILESGVDIVATSNIEVIA